MAYDLKRMLDVAKNPTAAFDYEVAREIASALGRLGRALETALDALAKFDEANMEAAGAARSAERRTLVAKAAHALWQFSVQRESCGLRDNRQMMRDYRVPAEIQHRMGVLAPERNRGRSRS